MRDFTLRRARKEDIPSLMELIMELAIFEKAPHEVSLSLEEFAEAGFGNNPVYTCYIAEMKGKIVGMALYYIRFSTWKGKRIYLEDLIVNQDYRGLGIGQALFFRCLEDADQLGYHGMTWQVLDWNEPAIKFYQRFGSSFDGEWLNSGLSEEKIKEIMDLESKKK